MNGYMRQWIVPVSLIFVGLVSYAAFKQRPAAAADTTTASTWSKADAAAYLDGRMHQWMIWSGSARGRQTACISCHTGMPIALARPALGRSLGETVAGPAEQSMIDSVSSRIESWDNILASKDYNQCTTYYTDQKTASLGTESIMDALLMVNHDVRRAHGLLSSTTNDALDYLWQQQRPDGSWAWIEFGNRPWEGDSAYYGTTLAALAVGMSGKNYYEKPDIQSNIASMRGYLQGKFSSRPLHDQVCCLWASTYLPGLVSSDVQSRLIDRLYSIQESNGAWSLSKLGMTETSTTGWGSGVVYPVGSVGDGFATGLVALTLKRCGVPSSNPHLRSALVWLSSNEVSGSWPADYINGARDPQSNEGGFMRDASTAFAVLALSEPNRK